MTSSKRSKKGDASSGGGSSKKARKEGSKDTNKQHSSAAAVMMTIPRKKDKSAKSSSSAPEMAAIPKIPKKSALKTTPIVLQEHDVDRPIPKKTASAVPAISEVTEKPQQPEEVEHDTDQADELSASPLPTLPPPPVQPLPASKVSKKVSQKKQSTSKSTASKSKPQEASVPTEAIAAAVADSTTTNHEKQGLVSSDSQQSLVADASSHKHSDGSETDGSVDATKRKTPLEQLLPHNATPAQDLHPYARASVIEVLHGVDDAIVDNDWWSEDSEDEMPEKKQSSVRLCDVIDRIPVGDNKWRYYVHYRDFNRRMDEWVSMHRIISPPSVGNAKARALKKEEEREKRRQQRVLEKKTEKNVDISAPRASRRRNSIQKGGETLADAEKNPAAGSQENVDAEAPRRTRLQKRKSFHDDDVTVMAANHDVSANLGIAEPPPPPAVITAEKGIVAISTTAATTTTVGEHVVATVPAQELDEHEGLDEASLREHEEVTKVKNVAFLELGPYQMETWYFSPIPKEILSEKGLVEVLYVCEFSFAMFARKSELRRFQSRLPIQKRHPPGNEIYRNGNLAMFEVDGFEERIYCQNLCYIAKLFLDHKTLYFDVDPFLFYVMCEVDDRGFHPVGYYSKEKYSDVGYNLACILTFPSHQRKGYGRFLIAFSYELSKKEERVGSPEKPMSDLGQQAYKPYWSSTIVDFLLNQSGESSLSIMEISKATSIMAEDIIYTLNQLGILKIINDVYFIAAEENLLKKLAQKYPVKNPRVDPTKLHWTPFLTDVKRDKFSIHSKKASIDTEEKKTPV